MQVGLLNRIIFPLPFSQQKAMQFHPKNLILDRTVEQGPLVVRVGKESFTDLDYTDDMSPSSQKCWEMLQTLVTGHLMLQEKDALQTNWTKQTFSKSGNAIMVLVAATWWTTLSASDRWYHMMEEDRLRYCDTLGSRGLFLPRIKEYLELSYLYTNQWCTFKDLCPSSPTFLSWVRSMDRARANGQVRSNVQWPELSSEYPAAV